MQKENYAKIIIMISIFLLPVLFGYPASGSVLEDENRQYSLRTDHSFQIPFQDQKDQMQMKNAEKILEAPFQRYREQIRQQDISRKKRTLQTELDDLTPPTPPTFIQARSQNYFSIMAEWGESEDQESGIDYYAYAIGTGTGSYSEMGNVIWWQSTSLRRKDTAYLDLDPTETYYVSIRAVNGNGLDSEIISSGPINPFWEDIGEAGNIIEIVFADYGYDQNGNTIEGWSDEQKAIMAEFANKMYPIIEELYGVPATSYTLTIVRDLYYSNSAIFIPSLDEVHMNDNFYPQLFTHELIHAFRNDYTVTSDDSWYYDPTLSGFEEGFAQGLSYECMNRYIELYPEDEIVNTHVVWLSDYDWDYDFQNVDELRGTDFWSARGGVGLTWSRYEMAAAAMRKINIESPGFHKRFNQEYYARLNNDHDLRPSRELVVAIIESITPTIGGISTTAWIENQHIFYCQNVYGKKVWHNIQDYPSYELWAFQTLYFIETMSCGSEWACWDSGQGRYVYHDLNGSQGEAKLFDWNNIRIWDGSLLIEPTTNPDEPDGYWGFGYEEKNLTTASAQNPWPGGEEDDDSIFDLDELGLYRFEASFVEDSSADSATNSIYRVLGEEISNNFKGVWGGVIGHRKGIVYLNHEYFGNEEALEVHNSAFYGERNWTGVFNEKTGHYDSVPGKVFITFIDAEDGKIYHTQRNIDYGSGNGNQMFLIHVQQSTVAPYTINPISHNFSSVNITTSSVPQTFSITNIGLDNLAIISLSITGKDASEFDIHNDNCSDETLSPSGTCTVEIAFSPDSTGAKSANLSIPFDSVDIPILEVPVAGTGIEQVLFVDFGAAGLWHFDGETWNRISSADATGLEEFCGDLAANFNAASLYIYDGLWTRISSGNAEDMVAMCPNLFADFGSAGLWQYDSTTTQWEMISTANPEGLETYDNKLVADFGATGLYEYDGSWTRISTGNCESMKGAGATLYADFSSAGLWQYSGSWERISTGDAEQMDTYDNRLVADFGTSGLYEYDGTWSRISTGDAGEIIDCGPDLFVDFDGFGLWRYSAGTWTRISTGDPEDLECRGDKLAVDFGIYGLYEFDDTWTSISTSDAEEMANVNIND